MVPGLTKFLREEASAAAQKFDSPIALKPLTAMLFTGRAITGAAFICSKVLQKMAMQAEATLENPTATSSEPGRLTIADSPSGAFTIPTLKWLLKYIIKPCSGRTSGATEKLLELLNYTESVINKPLPKYVNATLNMAVMALCFLYFKRPESFKQLIRFPKNAAIKLTKNLLNLKLLALLSIAINIKLIKTNNTTPAIAPTAPVEPTTTSTQSSSTATPSVTINFAPTSTSATSTIPQTSERASPPATPSQESSARFTRLSAAAESVEASAFDPRPPIDQASCFLRFINQNATEKNWRAIQMTNLASLFDLIQDNGREFRENSFFVFEFRGAMCNIVKGWGWDLHRNASANNQQAWNLNTQGPMRLQYMIDAARALGVKRLPEDLESLQRDQFKTIV